MSDLKVGDVVLQDGAPVGQQYVIVEIQPPLIRGSNIRRVLINEVDGTDTPFGVGEDRLTKVTPGAGG